MGKMADESVERQQGGVADGREYSFSFWGLSFGADAPFAWEDHGGGTDPRNVAVMACNTL
jgi:hypothetical protein